jgi:hypothetical protein
VVACTATPMSRLDAAEGTLITMAKHGDPASDNGRPANTTYDHSKTKDVSDAGGGRHSGEDKGGQDSGEDQGGKDEK